MLFYIIITTTATTNKYFFFLSISFILYSNIIVVFFSLTNYFSASGFFYSLKTRQTPPAPSPARRARSGFGLATKLATNPQFWRMEGGNGGTGEGFDVLLF